MSANPESPENEEKSITVGEDTLTGSIVIDYDEELDLVEYMGDYTEENDLEALRKLEYELEQEKNLKAIQRLKQQLDEFQSKLKDPKFKKLLVIRLVLYLGLSALMVYLVAFIPHPVWAFIAGVLGAYIISISVNAVMRKLEMQGDFNEIKKDKRREFFQMVINSFPMMPPIVKNNVINLTQKGRTAKLTVEIHKIKQFRETMELFLKARQEFRDEKFSLAKDTLESVLQKANKYGLDDIKVEAEHLIGVIDSNHPHPL